MEKHIGDVGFFTLSSCNNSRIRERYTITDSTIKKAPLKEQDDNRWLFGRWCGVGDSESSFQIDTNEIFYYYAVKAYKYTLIDQVLKIKLDDYVS